MTQTRRLAAILAADVAGYSRLIGADESGTLQAFKTIKAEVFDPTIAAHSGRLVKTTGDGFLVEFSSVVDVLRCAVEAQASMTQRNAEISSDRRIEFRMGIIDILLWNFPLKSHFADAAEAQPQAPPVQSSEIARHPSCRRRSPAPLPSCSWTCPRRRAQPICDILRLPALPNGTPGFGHFVRIDRRIAPDGRRRLCQIAVSMTPGMDRADPDAIA